MNMSYEIDEPSHSLYENTKSLEMSFGKSEGYMSEGYKSEGYS